MFKNLEIPMLYENLVTLRLLVILFKITNHLNAMRFDEDEAQINRNCRGSPS